MTTSIPRKPGHFSKLAPIAKIDVLGREQRELAQIATVLRPTGVRIKLAERVETSAMRDLCASMGFKLFQGYLFSRP